MQKRHRIPFAVVCIMSGILSLLSNLTYLLGIRQTPEGTIYLGATHHWEDFMFYTSQFMQGAKGALFNINLFTEEATTPTLLYFPNMLLGHIGQLVPVMPSTIYNISCIVLSFCILVGAYILFVRLFPNKQLAPIAWLFFAFSTSFMNKLPTGLAESYWPFDLWGTPHFLFNRIGGMPHRLVMTILFFISVELLFDKKIPLPKWLQMLLSCISVFGLTLLQPIAGILLLGVYVAAVVMYRQAAHPYTIVGSTIGGTLAMLYFIMLYTSDPYVQALGTEGKWQTITSFFFLLRSIGPIVFFAFIGMLSVGKKPTPIERFGGMLLIETYTLFLFPILKQLGISNVRLLFPAAYLFLAWFAAVGLEKISLLLPKVTKFSKIQARVMLCILFLVTVSPTVFWEIKQKTVAAETTRNNYLYYLPSSTYEALSYIKTLQDQPVILGNPVSHTDVLIPAYTGQKTVTGPLYATVNHSQKTAEATQLFARTMASEAAHTWLRHHHVTHVLFTVYDGDRMLFQTAYPFATPIFSTPTAVVYRIE